MNLKLSVNGLYNPRERNYNILRNLKGGLCYLRNFPDWCRGMQTIREFSERMVEKPLNPLIIDINSIATR